MNYIILEVPPYPFFIYSGDALYRPGDFHRKRSGIECFDLLFVEYGSLYMKVEHSHYHVKANEALIMPAGRAHEAYRVCDEKTYFHWLHFNATGYSQVSDTFNNDLKLQGRIPDKKKYSETLILPVFQSISEANSSVVIELMNRLESLRVNRYFQSKLTTKEGYSYAPLKQQQQFLDLLSYFIHTDNPSGSNEIATVLMQYLQTNYASHISLQDMAKVANCHPTHVIRCFKQRYDVTPINALTHIRLQQAKILLKSTDISCEKIAFSVGFSSASYFSKLFKAYYKTAPHDYRKKL